ncbi:MAG: hypothetical protein RLZZ384_1448, partial [Pseudomonadota bacterium]
GQRGGDVRSFERELQRGRAVLERHHLPGYHVLDRDGRPQDGCEGFNASDERDERDKLRVDEEDTGDNVAQQDVHDKMRDILTHFEVLQTQMIHDLKKALYDEPQRKNITPHSTSQDVDSTLNHLIQLLKDDDMAALTFFNEHSALLTFALGMDVFTNLADLIRNVDFEQACELIEQVKQSI